MKIKKAEKIEKKDYFSLAREIHLINQQRLALEKREKELKKELTEFMSKQPLDAKKNFYLPFDSADGKTYYAKWEARQSMSLSLDKIKEVFAGKEFLPEIVQKVEQEYVNEDVISELCVNGDISFEEFESITNRSISWALKFVNKKEEAEDAN